MTVRRGPRNAEARLSRLLVMLPWLMERGETSVDEVAERFDLTEAELVKDLELASMCGLPPFVDELIDVFIDEGRVFVGIPRLFTRSLRLNSIEAVELLAAARTAMNLPGADVDGPLGRGLRKLATAVGEDDTGVLSVDLVRPPLADEVATATERHERLAIEYYSASSDVVNERTIVPRQVYADRGAWYVTADDDRTGELRTFRIDRMQSVHGTGEIVSPRDEPLPTPGEWFADGSVPRATLRFNAGARGVLERYPADAIGDPDSKGRVTATVPVVNENWLRTIVLRLGPGAEVLSPGEWVSVGADTARRILDRYS